MGGFRGFSALLRSFCEDESGQATLEYILLLSFTVTGTIALARVIRDTLDKGVLRLGAQLEMDLKTGRADLSAWKN
jgi:hypothetical protein